MIRLKKLTALLVSAALVLALLAGCGGSKALSQVIAGLLSGQYNNVTVEVDPDLTAALKKAAEAGSTQEEVLAALVENLNLSGGSITFNNLGDGQQGQHGVTLTFQPGSDPDAAARTAVNGWASAFGSLPDDGSYRAHVSMIEAEGGYYIAVDVEVLKAGSPDKDEPDEPDKPDEPYTKDENGSYTVNTSDGLQKLFNDESKTFDENTVIELKTDTTYTVAGAQHLADTFEGTLKSADENTKASITLSGSAGLFGTLDGGKVENLSVTVTNNINTGTYDTYGGTSVGAVADINKGQITGCEVTISSGISSSNSEQSGIASAGGIAGWNTNSSSISNCKVTVNGSISAARNADSNAAYAGGIAGSSNGSISGCTVTLTGSGSISATGANSAGACAGGIAGSNSNNIESGCTVTLTGSGSISATSTSASAYAGGIAGSSNGTVSCGPATGTVTITATSGSNTVTVPYIDGSSTHNTKQESSAYAGTTCGYNSKISGPQ